jgi:hypothetical protein
MCLQKLVLVVNDLGLANPVSGAGSRQREQEQFHFAVQARKPGKAKIMAGCRKKWDLGFRARHSRAQAFIALSPHSLACLYW